MASLELDDQTARRLADEASAKGLTVAAYIQTLLQTAASPRAPRPPRGAAEEFERDLEPLLFDGPSLPPDFSRGDIYSDHD